MAQIEFRMNLQSKLFPLLTKTQGQTVIIPDRDQTYVPNVNPSDDQNPVDRGIPGVYFAQNVMPSTYGWQSVGFKKNVGKLYGGGGEGLISSIIHYPRTTNGYSTYVTINRITGRVEAINMDYQWREVDGFEEIITDDSELSVATINGVSYLCIPGRGVYRITMGEIPYFEYVELKGINNQAIQGILASSGYLIAWTTTGIAWSSTSDITDFEPSDVTGAGAGEIQDASGAIVWCQTTSYGMIIYTQGNAIQATWSGNTNFPWNFRGIPATGGIESPRLVSKEANGQHWVYTTKGLQQIYHTGAKTVLPFITDVVSGHELEAYDPDTEEIISYIYDRPLKKAISYIGDRYLCVSYGPPDMHRFTHAIIFDTVQLRIGKIKFDHVQIFEISSFGEDYAENARDNIGLVQESGEIFALDFRTDAYQHDSYLFLGKFQVARGYMTQLLGVEVECLEGSWDNEINEFNVIAYPSMDGKLFARVNAVDSYRVTPYEWPNYREFLFSHWAKSHLIMIRGNFNLVSAQLKFNVDSKR